MADDPFAGIDPVQLAMMRAAAGVPQPPAAANPLPPIGSDIQPSPDGQQMQPKNFDPMVAPPYGLPPDPNTMHPNDVTAPPPQSQAALTPGPAAAPSPFTYSPSRLRAIDANGRISDAITRAAQQHGGGVITPELAKVIAHIESSGNPNAQTGSYRGLFQLDDRGFQKYGGGSSIYDPDANAAAGVRSLAADAASFKRAMGRDPTPTELYMSHQQGQGGVIQHVRNPDQPAWQSMYSTGEGRSKGEAWAKRAIWGNIPDSEKARFGSVDKVMSRDLMSMYENRIGSGGGSVPAGASGGVMVAQNGPPVSPGGGVGAPAGAPAESGGGISPDLTTRLAGIASMLGGGQKKQGLPFPVADAAHADPAGEAAYRARMLAMARAAASGSSVG